MCSFTATVLGLANAVSELMPIESEAFSRSAEIPSE